MYPDFPCSHIWAIGYFPKSLVQQQSFFCCSVLARRAVAVFLHKHATAQLARHTMSCLMDDVTNDLIARQKTQEWKTWVLYVKAIHVLVCVFFSDFNYVHLNLLNILP